MRPSVVVYRPLPAPVEATLSPHCELHLVDPAAGAGGRRLRAALRDADALIGSGLALTPADFDAAPRLRAISSIAAGYDAFDLPDLARRGITLMNTPGTMAEATADLAFALMLAAARRLFSLSRRVHDGAWTARIGAEDYGVDVGGRTLGIVGMGRVGQAIARRGAGGFGMPVIYTARSPKPELDATLPARRVQLETLLAEADFVCLAVPLTPATRDLIGQRELALMKPESILVNVARGEVLDERALGDALESGRIFGAALDVVRTEPLGSPFPFDEHANVTVLPHVGSATRATRLTMARCAADNLIGFFAGAPRNVVHAAAG